MFELPLECWLAADLAQLQFAVAQALRAAFGCAKEYFVCSAEDAGSSTFIFFT